MIFEVMTGVVVEHAAKFVTGVGSKDVVCHWVDLIDDCVWVSDYSVVSSVVGCSATS